MKILKIESNQGYYAFIKDDWKPIDQVEKDDLLKLVNLLLETEVEMDPFDENLLKNKAHQIIYKSLYEKLIGLSEDKNKFKDESDRTYLDAFKRYQL